jgi:primase-polymerase (primpol)-like protein
LDYLLEKRRPQDGLQRYVDKAEGFTYVDIDKVRDPATGEVEEWAQALIDELDTYCEISASGRGFHLVARAALPEDYHVDPCQVEIYAGNIPNKLLAMTGDVYDLHLTIKNRQADVENLLRRAKRGEFNEYATQTPSADWRSNFYRRAGRAR